MLQMLPASPPHPLDDLKGLAGGRLQIGAGVTIAAYILPPLLTAFKKAAPGVELTVETGFSGQIVDKVLAGTVELGLTGHYSPHPRLTVQTILKDPLVLIASLQHEWAKARAPVDLAELADETFLLSKKGSGTWQLVSAFLEESGIVLKNTMELGTTEGVKQAVAAGLGVSILSRHVLKLELAAGTVKEIPLAGGGTQRELYVVCRKDRFLSQAAQAFLARLQHLEPTEPVSP